ncbi:DUF411 domain-containing protein [Lysobacter humi (ex Lee et al. 2017)]
MKPDLSVICAVVLLAACTPSSPDAARSTSAPAPSTTSQPLPAAPPTTDIATPPAKSSGADTAPKVAVDADLPKVLVHKTPSCGCCTAWAEHMQRHGFAVEIRESADLEPIRKRLGVPAGKGSCHTAEVGGLVVEGHVPAEDVKRLLAANDGSRGLTVPGMPMGSPGMEMPDGRVQRYTVERIDAEGTTQPYAVHGD